MSARFYLSHQINDMTRLLLLSNSTNPGDEYLGWAKRHIEKFLEGVEENILFIPYAGVTVNWDDYYESVNDVVSSFSKQMDSIHHFQDPVKAIQQANAVLVGGGNTFRLFALCQEQGLYTHLRKKVEEGIPYIGWSAGSNLACPRLSTSNDMPIYEPPSFDGLELIPFQINPHYTNKTIEGHGGESRDQRLAEYLVLNRESTVLALPEASLLKVEANTYSIEGNDAILITADSREDWKNGESKNF